MRELKRIVVRKELREIRRTPPGVRELKRQALPNQPQRHLSRTPPGVRELKRWYAV